MPDTPKDANFPCVCALRRDARHAQGCEFPQCDFSAVFSFGRYAAHAHTHAQPGDSEACASHCSLTRAVASAQTLSATANDTLISVDQLLVAMVQDGGSASLLAPFGLTSAAAKNAVDNIRKQVS